MSGPEFQHRPDNHPAVSTGRIGVLLVNLGTPDGTDTPSVRRYLREFLSDRRVIEANPLLWSVVLNFVILPFRAPKSGHAYRTVWDTGRDESPLRTVTRAQATALAERFAEGDETVVIDWAMRYGSPAIDDRIEALKAQGCDRILLFALYPQYSASTTATAYDAAFRGLMRMRWQPAVRTAPAYYEDPAYIAALADSVRRHIAEVGWSPEVILASFHGIPQSYFEAGDPYHCQCQKTGRLLREALGLDDRQLRVTFQSRFGPREWLQPYTDKTLEALPDENVRDVMVITPGFAADCLETLEEIAIAGKQQFLDAGGERFSAIPCLNANDTHIGMLAQLVRRELGGWLPENDIQTAVEQEDNHAWQAASHAG